MLTYLITLADGIMMIISTKQFHRVIHEIWNKVLIIGNEFKLINVYIDEIEGIS